LRLLLDVAADIAAATVLSGRKVGNRPQRSSSLSALRPGHYRDDGSIGAVELNDVGYIIPGLGDAGDRLYGVV